MTWNRMKICQNPIIDVSLVSCIKQRASTFNMHLHFLYNLIFPEITSLLNKTDLCLNRSPLCQLELQRERGDWQKIDAPEIFISRDISFTGEREEKGAMEAGRRLGII